MSGLLRSLFLFVSFALLSCLPANAQPSMHFIPNNNQWPSDVFFVSNIPGGKMILRGGGVAYHFAEGSEHEKHPRAGDHGNDGEVSARQLRQEHFLKVNFAGSSAESLPMARENLDFYYNFFLGQDPARWATEVHPSKKVYYGELYPGIDLQLYAADTNMKYDLIVAPGADPAVISMEYEGAWDLCLENGNLYVSTSLVMITERRPYAYQIKDNIRSGIACEFRLRGNRVSFYFPEGYDPRYELIIDPLLIFSTYSGSTADNWGSTAAPGEHGTLYSAGVTRQDLGGAFPTTPGAFQTTNGGQYDIGILKYDSAGTRLLYSTHLGGSFSESPHSLIVDSNRELILLGTTSSPDFPVTEGAFDETFNSGISGSAPIGIPYWNGSDMIITRFSGNGTELVGSTFLGGSDNDGLNLFQGALTRNYGDEMRGDVITDEDGSIYIASVSSSGDLPFVSGYDTRYRGGGTDGIVVKLSADLKAMFWGTYLGGAGTDACHSIKLDNLRNIVVAGGTTSSDFPVSLNSFQKEIAGDADGWIAKLTSDGSGILSCTFTGTPAYDQVYFLDLNKDDDVYVYGQTSGDFYVSPDVYSNPGSAQFVQKFDRSLSAIRFSTVFGSGRGLPDISPTAFLVNDCNNIYLAGWGGGINNLADYWPGNSSTQGMVVSPDAFQKTTFGNDFYFLVLTDDARNFLYGTFLGGPQSLTHVDGGTSRFDKSGIVYHAVCSGCDTDMRGPKSDFPTTRDAWSRTNNSLNCNNAAFKFDLSSLSARIRTNSPAYNSPGIEFICIPDMIRFQNTSIGGKIFEWDFGDGTRTVRTDTTSILHAYQSEGSYHVKMKAIDAGTCKGVDSTSLILKVYKKHIEVQDDDQVCQGQRYKLQASGGVNYQWTSTDPTFSSVVAEPVVGPSDTTAYFVHITDINGCSQKDTVVLNLIPAIVPAFNIARDSDCSKRPDILVTNLSDSLWAGDRMLFQLGDGTTSDQFSFSHRYESDGLYNITLLGERSGCVFAKTTVFPLFTLKIPNVMTPQGDGVNDSFRIQYGEADQTPGSFGFHSSLIVYNRWGRVVFQDKDYGNDWQATGLAAGVYFYELDIEGHASCRGWVQVLR